MLRFPSKVSGNFQDIYLQFFSPLQPSAFKHLCSQVQVQGQANKKYYDIVFLVCLCLILDLKAQLCKNVIFLYLSANNLNLKK